MENKRERPIFTETLYLSSSFQLEDDGEYHEIIKGYEFWEMPYYCPKDGCGNDVGKNSIDYLLKRNDTFEEQNYFKTFKLRFDYDHDWRI